MQRKFCKYPLFSKHMYGFSMLIPIFRDDTKNKLADKLFEHSATRDQLLMMPSVSLTIIIVWLIRRTNIAIF